MKAFQTIETERDIDAVLDYLGHSQRTSNRRDAIASYQTMSGIIPTGNWTWLESNALANRFCSCPDFQEANTSLQHWDENELKVWHDIANFVVNGDDWFLSACRWWSEVCNLDFVTVNSKAEADIFAHWRRIDGPGSVLAWSMLPFANMRSGTRQLEQRYDSADISAYRSRAYSEKVIAHEIGHAIGFQHSRNRSDLMFASILDARKYLGPGDRAGAIERYGVRTQPPVDPPVDPPTEQCPANNTSLTIDGKKYVGFLTAES